MPVLVAYASKHGSTQGIAERIAAILRSAHVIFLPVGYLAEPRFPGYVSGSAPAGAGYEIGADRMECGRPRPR